MKKKTFREVITTIKEGETWVNDIAPISYIRLREDGVLDFNENEGVNLFCTYTLQKKQCTFEEAFKAYEEGKEIESLVSEIKYRRFDEKVSLFVVGENEDFSSINNDNAIFSINEIRGKWYINN